VVAIATIIGITLEWEWPASVQNEELLGGRVLEVTDADEDVLEVARAREESEPTVVDGKPATMHRARYTNGQVEYEHTYVNDKPHGWHRDWNPAGQLMHEEHWTDGFRQGHFTQWYANGQRAAEGEYALARPIGKHLTWHRNGQPSTDTEYQNGLRHGGFVAWHPNGQQWCQSWFHDDRLDGTWQKWAPDGVLVHQLEFKNGVLVAEWPARRREPFSYPGILGSPDFAFILRQGSGLSGYTTFRVSASGLCEFTYFVIEERLATEADANQVIHGMGWRRTEFQLSSEMQRQLRDALMAARVLRLRAEYADQHVDDGTQWEVGLRVAGEEKRVFCSNRFPVVLVELSRTIRDQIIVPHRMEVLTASRVEPRQADNGWLEDPIPIPAGR
jgi:antitoxin component YwqK of YwqJK toxin-antitoxin module